MTKLFASIFGAIALLFPAADIGCYTPMSTDGTLIDYVTVRGQWEWNGSGYVHNCYAGPGDTIRKTYALGRCGGGNYVYPGACWKITTSKATPATGGRC